MLYCCKSVRTPDILLRAVNINAGDGLRAINEVIQKGAKIIYSDSITRK
jgi:hypothetical protein